MELQEGQGRLARGVASTMDPTAPPGDAGPKPEEGMGPTGRT